MNKSTFRVVKGTIGRQEVISNKRNCDYLKFVFLCTSFSVFEILYKGRLHFMIL